MISRKHPTFRTKASKFKRGLSKIKLNATVSISLAYEGFSFFFFFFAYNAAYKFKVQEALLPINDL